MQKTSNLQRAAIETLADEIRRLRAQTETLKTEVALLQGRLRIAEYWKSTMRPWLPGK